MPIKVTISRMVGIFVYVMPIFAINVCVDVYIRRVFCKKKKKIRVGILVRPIFKDVIRNRFNFILEERVKFSEQNSENLMKIGWKIRKLWNFEISQIFKKQFLTSRYEYANERVDDVIASQFSIHFVYRNDKNFIFQLRER